MIAAVIRHAKVDIEWEFWQTSSEYDKGCADYDSAPVLPVTVKLPNVEFDAVYVSGLPRTEMTARQVVGDREVHATTLINEVPEKSGFDTDMKLPGMLWSVISRIQWFLGSRRQPESRKETERRAEEFVKYLISRNENCAIFTHGFFMITLIRVMKKHGFRADHTRLDYSNGECVVCKR